MNERPSPETDAHQFTRNLERQRDEARERIQIMLKHDATRLESDSIVGSCDCQTKTSEVKYHKPGCKYRLISERDEAREELENWKASGVHSCHADCKRPLCAANRQIKAMREAIKEAEDLLVAVDNGAQQDVGGVNWYDRRKLALAELQPFLKP